MESGIDSLSVPSKPLSCDIDMTDVNAGLMLTVSTTEQLDLS